MNRQETRAQVKIDAQEIIGCASYEKAAALAKRAKKVGLVGLARALRDWATAEDVVGRAYVRVDKLSELTKRELGR